MDTYDKIYDILEKELDEIAEKGSLTSDSLMSLDKIVDIIIDIDEICNKDNGGYSQRGYAYGGNSYRRGNGNRGGYSRTNANRNNRGYSRRDDREEILNHLDYLMETSGTEKERQAIKEALNALENM